MTAPVELALLGTIAVLCAGFAVWLLIRKRLGPEEIERMRRLQIHAKGRLVDGIVSDIRGSDLIYDYSWRGMQYQSSQDVSSLHRFQLVELEQLIGPVTIKFDTRNPYNSIVLCEEWSGFPKNKVDISMPAPR